MATLFIASGPQDGSYFPLGKKTLVLGRDEGLMGQVRDANVSRKHASIRFDAVSESYRIADMGSKNGTFINDEKISAEQRLNTNDLVRLGDTLLLFVEDDFEGDDNALNFYRERGQRIIETQKMGGQNVQDAFRKLKDQAGE